MPHARLRRWAPALGAGAAIALIGGGFAAATPGGQQPAAAPLAPQVLQAAEPTVELGVERLLSDPEELALLDGKRVGLITNPTGVDSELRHSMDLLIAGEEEGNYELTALYAPEHGILGGAPAGAGVESYVDPRTGLTVWSLYGATQRPTEEMLEDVDVLLFDIQDIGARFYTYIWTMYYAMDAAAEFDKEFIVLDRPNPLGDRMDGPVLDPELSSFVGLREIPMQHGLTVGELASLFNGEFLDEPVEDFHVVELTGYDPADFVTGYGLEWVLPSPNIPTIETAWAYAGTGLIESLNASEGRGTTTPFLWIGHGDIDEVGAYELAEDLNSRGLEGVHFRPMFANPTTSKQAGVLSGGVQLHITDPEAYVPVRTGLHVLEAFYATDGVDWREGTVYPDQQCETEEDICWIDRLSGDRDVRLQLEAGVDPDDIIAGWDEELAAFDAVAEEYRRYQQEPPTEEPTTEEPTTEEPTTEEPTTEAPTTAEPTTAPGEEDDDTGGTGGTGDDDAGAGTGDDAAPGGTDASGRLPSTGAPILWAGLAALALLTLGGAVAWRRHQLS